ncbi:hypothetical protein D3C87_1188810 [compost metagenome]
MARSGAGEVIEQMHDPVLLHERLLRKHMTVYIVESGPWPDQAAVSYKAVSAL